MLNFIVAVSHFQVHNCICIVVVVAVGCYRNRKRNYKWPWVEINVCQMRLCACVEDLVSMYNVMPMPPTLFAIRTCVQVHRSELVAKP